MVSVSVSEFILVVAVLIIGLVLFGFIEAYVTPIYAFNLGEQQARALSQATIISISPPGITLNGKISYVIDIYIPGYNGNVSLVVFTIPSNDISSIAVVTPSQGSTSGLTVELPNRVTPAQVNINNSIYDLNGHVLATNIQAYSVPSNQQVIVSGTYSPSNILVVWIIYYSNGYYFRIAYTYQGE